MSDDENYTVILVDGPALGRVIKIGTAQTVRVLLSSIPASAVVELPEDQVAQFATYDRTGHQIEAGV